MRFIFALAAFAATAAAAPWANWGVSHGLNYPRTTSNCMSDSDATKVANNFKTLIAAYSDSFSNKTMAVDFVDYSDSVMELINGGCEGPEVLGTAVFSSRAEFQAGQGAQPPIPFEIIKTWNACSAVTIRWQSAQTPQLVTGIIVIEVVKNADKKASQKWLIKTVYSEFNSGAWLVNLDVFNPPVCPAPPPPTSTPSRRMLFV